MVRVADSIAVCYIRDCDRMPIDGWPLCYYHGAAFASQIFGGVHKEYESKRVEKAAPEAKFKAHEHQGDIYCLRLNGLIKIGWSSDLIGRIHSYGPRVEVLCTFPGSRADERDLHRALKACRAHGREWYEYRGEVKRWVAEMILEHGSADVIDYWSTPTEPGARSKSRVTLRRGHRTIN